MVSFFIKLIKNCQLKGGIAIKYYLCFPPKKKLYEPLKSGL